MVVLWFVGVGTIGGSRRAGRLLFVLLRFGLGVLGRPWRLGGGRGDDPLMEPIADVTEGGTQAPNLSNKS